MTAEMYRVPVSEVKAAGKYSFIQDNGALIPANNNDQGTYFFSQKGVGVRAMALIGNWQDVCNWLSRYSKRSIKNTISELPDIYMEAGFYVPGKRFIGCFPIGDAVISAIQDVSPGDMLTDIAEGANYFYEKIKAAIRSKPRPTSLASTMAYVNFTYMPGEGMEKIGSGEMTMEQIQPFVVKGLSSLV